MTIVYIERGIYRTIIALIEPATRKRRVSRFTQHVSGSLLMRGQVEFTEDRGRIRVAPERETYHARA